MVEYEMETMYLKTYKVNGEVLVAACDCEVMGKTFEEGELCLEVTSDFFGEDVVSAQELEVALTDATIANMVGEKAVACAIKLDCVDGDCVLNIGGVPCAQMVRM